MTTTDKDPIEALRYFLLPHTVFQSEVVSKPIILQNKYLMKFYDLTNLFCFHSREKIQFSYLNLLL